MRYIEAVRAQGKNLRTSRAAVTDRLDRLDLAPWRNRRLAITGMGASSNAVASVLGAYWSAELPASGWLGSELELAGPAAGAEAVIAVSQTGKSAEIHSALQHLPDGCPRLAVTDAEDSPVAGLADAILPLALLEDSAVRTIGYTGTVQALLLLRDALVPGHAPAADWDQLADDLELQQDPAEELAQRVLPTLRGVTAFDVVGSGMHAGTAAQGALLLREVCKLPASGYETYQYLHGPVEAAGTGRALIAIGGAREARLAASMAAAGATALLITAADTDADEQPGLTVFRLPQPDQAQPGQAQPGQAQPGQAQPGQAQPGQAQPGQAQPDRSPADAAGDDLAQAVLAILPLQTISWQLAEDLGCADGEFLYHQDDTKVA